MADQYTPLPVKTKTAGDIVANINNGTVTALAAGTITAGTLTNLVSGTINSVGTVPGVGIVTRIGNIGTIESGTVTTTLALNTGTITTIAAGTQNTLGTVGTVIGVGTISNIVTTSGTVTGVGTVTNLGSVTNIGTLKGVDLVTRIGNIGTIESGTVTTTLALNSGTITTIAAGTQNTLGTVGVVNSVAAGTLNTLGTVGVINNIAGGTVTLTNPGGAPTSPQFSYQTSSALAAGALATLTFTAITNAKTGQLHKTIISSSVPIRGEVQRITDTGTVQANGTAGVIFTSAANPTSSWESPDKTYFTQASTGTAKFRAVITNMDNALAADVYSTAFWDEVTT